MTTNDDLDLSQFLEIDTQEFSCGSYDSNDSFIAPESDADGPLASADSGSDPESNESSGSDAGGGRLLFRWHLTKNGVDEEAVGIEEFKALCKLHCKKWAFQLERGAATSALHYQARISLRKKARKGRVRRLFIGCHVSPESNIGKHTGEFYAMKDETRVAGPWSDKDVNHYRDPRYDIADHYFPWQEEAMRRLITQDDRQILIVVDPTGHTGKTVLAHHIVLFHGGIFVPSFFQTGEDVLQFVHGFTAEGGRYIIVVDVPRAAVLSQLAGRLFAAFETIKGGYVYDRRYHAQARYLRPPRIVVFCNDEPDKTLLTGDRWDILRLPIGSVAGPMPEARSESGASEEGDELPTGEEESADADESSQDCEEDDDSSDSSADGSEDVSGRDDENGRAAILTNGVSCPLKEAGKKRRRLL